MTNREMDIDGILNGSLEALKAQDWARASALAQYAIAVMMHQGAQAPATPASVETPAEAEAEAPRRAPRRTSSAGDADCADCGERFNSKGGKYMRCFPCGKKAQVLCQVCKRNRHQPQFDECQECAYGEAA